MSVFSIVVISRAVMTLLTRAAIERCESSPYERSRNFYEPMTRRLTVRQLLLLFPSEGSRERRRSTLAPWILLEV